EPVDTGAGQALGARQHGAQGVFGPGPVALDVGGAGPQVDHEFAVDVGRHGSAEFVAQREVALELVPHPFEARRARPMNLDVPYAAHWRAFLPGKIPVFERATGIEPA